MYRVLIVEDDRTNRLFYRKLSVWQREGFSIVAEAGNGREALALLEAVDGGSGTETETRTAETGRRA